jgi:hypothetical protein
MDRVQGLWAAAAALVCTSMAAAHHADQAKPLAPMVLITIIMINMLMLAPVIVLHI